MLTAYLKRQWKLLLLLAGAVAVFAAVFALYSLPVEAVAYAGLLCLMLGLVLFALGYSAFLRRHRELEGLLRKVHESVLPLPPPRGVLEADYQALLRAVCADRVRLAAENRDRLEDMTDYYTLWAHQIKTPIAAARLLLQEDPGAVGTEVEVELLKIEQYWTWCWATCGWTARARTMSSGTRTWTACCGRRCGSSPGCSF